MNNIIFDNIKFKNFMAYGNAYTTFSFTNGMTLITGQNGHGKTAIMMALYYVLYGKSFKKNKLGSLVNDINMKDMKVELEFAVDGEEYKIIRGQKPNIFEIYKDNVIVSQSSTTAEYQDYLETYILKINENVFRQLIFLGANVAGSKSFIDLTKSEKEELFQIITDTSLFKIIKDNIKERSNGIKTATTELTYKINVLSETLLTEKSNIIKMEEQNKNINSVTSERVESINSRLIEIKDKQEAIKVGLGKLKNIKLLYEDNITKLNSLRSKQQETTTKYNELISKINKINTAKEAFKECIGCAKLNNISKIDLSEESKLVSNMQLLKSELEDNTVSIETLLITTQDQRQRLDKGKIGKDQFDALTEEQTRLNKEISSMQDQKPFVIDYDGIKVKQKEIDDLKTKYTDQSTELTKLKTLDGLLSNDNLKGVIINQTLPILNKYINEYIQKFSNFEFNFFIDSNFKDNIIFKSRDREFHSLSNGQGFRIMFSILFAFLKLVEDRNGVKTNLLILDEYLDGSLDKNGRHELLYILKEEFCENKNVIIISHNDDITNTTEYFDNSYKVELNNSFSKLQEI